MKKCPKMTEKYPRKLFFYKDEHRIEKYYYKEILTFFFISNLILKILNLKFKYKFFNFNTYTLITPAPAI